MGTNPIPLQPLVQASFAGRLRLDSVLRVGGQAAVFRGIRQRSASGQQTNEEVALKLYLDPNQNERVRREIETMQQVRHRCLANLLESGTVEITEHRYRYLVWEFVSGEALDHISQRGALPVIVCATIGRDISSAIDAIWSRRVVHRDVNPKNIILRAGNEGAVLIDLGIAKFIDRSPLTGPGVVWGTNGYMSPEQTMGFELSCQSDVFSLGVTLQHVLCGHHPTNFDQRHLGRLGGPRTSSLYASCPAILADILDKMVSRRAAYRPQPRALRDHFQEILRRI